MSTLIPPAALCILSTDTHPPIHQVSATPSPPPAPRVSRMGDLLGHPSTALTVAHYPHPTLPSPCLHTAGAKVAIIYHSAKDAEEVAAKLAKDHGVEVKAWKCDVGKADLVKKTFQEIDQTMGPVHGWVGRAICCVCVTLSCLRLISNDALLLRTLPLILLSPSSCPVSSPSEWRRPPRPTRPPTPADSRSCYQPVPASPLSRMLLT